MSDSSEKPCFWLCVEKKTLNLKVYFLFADPELMKCTACDRTMLVVRRTIRLDSKDFLLPNPTRSTTFITSFTAANYHISGTIWKQPPETTICAFWRTIKRCQTWFLLHCFGSGCQRFKDYLKEDSFSEEKKPARFADGDGQAQEPRSNWGEQKKWIHDKKSSDGGGRRWRGGIPTFPLSWEPGGWISETPPHRYQVQQVHQFRRAPVQTLWLSAAVEKCGGATKNANRWNQISKSGLIPLLSF